MLDAALRHSPPLLLRLHGVGKDFPGVRALDQVGFCLAAGEVVALVGENGAGKSTLIKILAGIHQPDEGQIFIDERRVTIPSPRAALDLGIHTIHQELNLAEHLSIAENIFLGNQPGRGPGWFPLTNRRELHRRAAHLVGRLGLDCPTETPVRHLSLAQRQLVEVAKALSTEARIVVFDEPTSSLSDGEVRRLMQLIVQLRLDGVGVLYISHRLAEVAELADRVVVLRDGRLAGELAREKIDSRQIVAMMTGRQARPQPARRPRAAGGPAALRVANLRYSGCRQAVRFDVGRGEIVGLAGLVGAGRSRLARALFGISRVQSATIEIDGRPVRVRCPHDAIAAGMCLVPEDRKAQGLFPHASLARNISLPMLPRLGRWGLLNHRAERELASRQIVALGIRAASADQKIGLLSGGNQQKAILARWLAMDPRVLVLDEPTRGIDVAAKGDVYQLISRLASQGVGILVISSDLEEVIGISDRVLVMRDGRLCGELAGPEINQQAIMHLAIGST